MKKILYSYVFISLGFFSACGTHNIVRKEYPEKALDLSAMDLSLRPQDDFYNFANGNWARTTSLPPTKSNWGAFTALREQTDNNSLRILLDLLKENPPQGSEAQKIKDLFLSYVNWQQRDQEGIKPIEEHLTRINAITSLADFQKYLEWGTPSGDNPVCAWGVRADMKDSSKNAVYLGVFSLGLPLNYYQKETPANEEALIKYQEYITTLFQLIKEENPHQKAEEVVTFEKRIAKGMFSNEKKRDPNNSYNRRSLDELDTMVKNLQLSAYLKNVGVHTQEVIIPEIGLYRQYDQLIFQENIPVLKNYLKARLVVSNAQRLTQQMDTLAFDFYEKYLKGKNRQRSLNMRALSIVNSLLGEAFGKLYVERYFSASSKEKVLDIADYLRMSLKERIQNAAWMSSFRTKWNALNKLYSLRVKIGYPDKWTDYASLTLHSGDVYYENLKNIRRWEYQNKLQKIGKPVDKEAWSMTPQQVNAYYSRQNNEIVFPAAILQPPFFNPEADPAVNFGRIGAIIGHEITHGFDDSGAEFDQEGNLNNWWKSSDKENFKKLTQALAHQFSQYEAVKGVFVNGVTTSGENIADLGGLSIAYDALQIYLEENGKIPKISGFTQEQRFFIAWTTLWRSIATDKYTANQVKTDPHTPQFIRAYAPFLNMDAFYKAFDVKEGDKLYKKPEDRVTLW